MAAAAATCTCSPLSLFRSSPARTFTVRPLLVSSPKFILHPDKISSSKLFASSPSSSSSHSSSNSKAPNGNDDLFASLLDSVLVLAASLAISLTLLVSDAGPASAFVVATPRKLQSDELATVRLFKDNTPSVVYITNLAVRQDAFTLDVLEVPQGSGTGFVWDKLGHIVTNYHVIRGASDLS